MTRRRSRQEILVDILRTIKREPVPTRIMYAANMSWSPLREMLRQLAEAGLVAKIPANGASDRRMRCKYRLTAKGETALRRQDEVNGLLNP